MTSLVGTLSFFDYIYLFVLFIYSFICLFVFKCIYIFKIIIYLRIYL